MPNRLNIHLKGKPLGTGITPDDLASRTEGFSGAEIASESSLQDLSWVGPRACRHEEIVERVMRYAPILPAQFGTLFSSFKSLEKLLHKNYDNIRRFLGQMKDKEEWSVKVLLDREKAKEKQINEALLPGRLSSSPR